MGEKGFHRRRVTGPPCGGGGLISPPVLAEETRAAGSAGFDLRGLPAPAARHARQRRHHRPGRNPRRRPEPVPRQLPRRDGLLDSPGLPAPPRPPDMGRQHAHRSAAPAGRRTRDLKLSPGGRGGSDQADPSPSGQLAGDADPGQERDPGSEPASRKARTVPDGRPPSPRERKRRFHARMSAQRALWASLTLVGAPTQPPRCRWPCLQQGTPTEDGLDDTLRRCGRPRQPADLQVARTRTRRRPHPVTRRAIGQVSVRESVGHGGRCRSDGC